MRRVSAVDIAVANIAVVALSAVACSLIFPRMGVEHYILHEVGNDAVRCGAFTRGALEPHTLSPQESESVSNCMSEAYAAGRPFYFLVEGPGTDSQLAWGMLMRADGLVRFKYDSAPCGREACNELFLMNTCSLPARGERIRPDMACWHGNTTDGPRGGRTRG